MAAMHIALLDPSLRMLEGHFTDLDLRLAQLWTAAGHKVTAYARADAPPSLDPHFKAAGIRLEKPFPVPPAAWYTRDFKDRDRIQRVAELNRDVLDGVRHFDLAVWPSANSACALGYAMSKQKAPVGFGVFEHPIALPSAATGVFAAAQAMLKDAGTPTLWGFYVDDFLPIWRTILVPGTAAKLANPTVAPPRLKNDGPLRVGLIGAQRAERRIDLTLPLAKALLAEGYSVILQDSRGEVAELSHERLTRHGFLADMSPVFAACDLIVWPATPRSYMGRPSGIVSEAIATGVPLVMSSACYPSQLAGEYGSAVFFQHAGEQEILAAIAHAAANIGNLRQKAVEKAAIWNRDNGIVRLAEQFLELVR